jgi:hypothetical protein
MMLLMVGACSSSDDEGGQKDSVSKKPAKLAIYVYSPGQGATRQTEGTRGDEGNVDVSNAAEGEIKSLKLWIYEHESGDYVGYLDTEDVASLNSGEGITYQIPVSDEFATNKPDVDVFVMANVKPANCGVSTLDENTSRANLMSGAKITGFFGLGNLQKSVPEQGLPMAGKQTTQSVVGDAPALRVGSMSQVSTVQVTRAVSKLRFVFSKTENQPKVTITSIKMNAEMIPNEVYLFKKPESVTISYNTDPVELLSNDIDDIAETADPTKYIYFDQEAQAYEDLINEAASKQPNPEVTIRGPIYLRESDKQLAGTITYKIGENGKSQTANFQMQQAGDFSRNHTWIVYAYYAGSGNLQVQTIYVKNWENREISHELYNW